jgi:hypothetical protein
MATLPRTVQRQLEAADAIVEKINTPAEPAADQKDEGQASATEGDQVEAANQPGEGNESVKPEAPQPSAQQVDWEHKFKTLQGLFNAEVPKLQGQVKQLNAKLQEVQTSVEQSKAKVDLPEDTRPETNAKDVEAFGEDLVEMVQRQFSGSIKALSAKIDTLLTPLAARVQTLEQQLQGTESAVKLTAEEVFFDRLSKTVPDWEQLNVDQRFLNWLEQVDPVYGEPRKAALTIARRNLDVARVTAVFSAFKDTLPKQPKTDTLAKQISPKSGTASVTPKPDQKPVIRESEVTAFYHDVATGKYRGRDKEMAEREAVINLALAEGRIQ